ncbi:unnamed protein product [Amoebophrya sp. A120]|nr:unnamed protein product [Amoebophrya sp. A120]|eukprot:GSA120T00018447001.1
MTSGSGSSTPNVMYSWRVQALETWMRKQAEKAGATTVTMETMLRAGHLDQYHYLGLDANDDVITLLQLDKTKKILDIGCGIGGPGRYIAWKTGCEVHGIDIQADLVESANRVAKEVGLDHLTQFQASDCTQSDCLFPLEGEAYDGFYCILVFLHIPLAPRLVGFQNTFRQLKPSATFVIEDYLLKVPSVSELTEEERHLLEDVIGAVCVPTVEEYTKHLTEIGFADVEFEDLTDVWTKWTVARRDRFLAKKSTQVALHGEAHVTKMETFYKAPPQLFESGKLGGYRITGRKPPADASGSLEAGRKLIAAKKTNELTVAALETIMDAQQTIAE